ncbi:MAG TPA: hypothetical protein VIV12_02555 [Streptosporangiaceae bacterium]
MPSDRFLASSTRFFLGRSEALTSHRASMVNVAVNEILSTGLRERRHADEARKRLRAEPAADERGGGPSLDISRSFESL